MGQSVMGQRLVINITDAYGKWLANAYYHWDAYTVSAIENAIKIIKTQMLFDMLNEFNNIPLKKKAIFLLESTGAGITPEDFQLKQYPDIWIPAKNRNEGLIQVTEESMKRAYYWEEGTIDIDISKKLINFNVFNEYSREEILELANDWDDKNFITNINNAIDIDIPNDYIEFLSFSKKLLDIHKVNQVYFFKDKYLMFIE